MGVFSVIVRQVQIIVHRKKENILTEEDLNKLLSKNLVPYLEKHLTEDKLNRFLSSDKGKNLINTIVECIKKSKRFHHQNVINNLNRPSHRFQR